MARKPIRRGMPKGPPRQKMVQVGANIRITKDQHAKLVTHCKNRLEFAKRAHDERTPTFADIDRQYSGFLEHTKEDRKRDQDNKKMRGLKPVDVSITWAAMQIEEVNADLLDIFGPNSDLYTALTDKSKQSIANALTEKMEYDANFTGTFTQLDFFLSNSMKYNYGPLLVEWDERFGSVIADSPDGQVEVNEGKVIWSGNLIEAADPYNTLIDPSVDPIKLHSHGEFFALVDRINQFKLDVMIDRNELYDAERFKDRNGAYSLYTAHPRIRTTNSDGRTTDTFDWANYISAGAISGAGGTEELYEITHLYIWLKGKDWGLSKTNRREIWRITMINGTNIGNIELLNNAHNFLPLLIGMPINDEMGVQAKTYAERLIPFQNFASFLMNIKQRGDRKALLGLTIYDPRIIDINAVDWDEVGQYPAKTEAMQAGRKIDDGIKTFYDGPRTETTLPDLGRVIDLMQLILPSKQDQQVAGLERATQYQAAATWQGSHKSAHRIAKILNDQVMVPYRFMITYNIYQYQETPLRITNKQTGEETTVNPKDLRSLGLEYNIGSGLKGLHKLQITEILREVLRSLMQTPDSWQRVDILGLLDYLTSIEGDDFSMEQFRIRSPLDQLTPEQKQVAFEAYQQVLQSQQTGGDNVRRIGNQ